MASAVPAVARAGADLAVSVVMMAFLPGGWVCAPVHGGAAKYSWNAHSIWSRSRGTGSGFTAPGQVLPHRAGGRLVLISLLGALPPRLPRAAFPGRRHPRPTWVPRRS